jgi:hypothetical protein
MSDAQREKSIQSEPVNRSSDRQFGLVMAGFFAVLSALAAWRGGWSWTVGWLAVAAVFLLVALLRPTLLGVLNRLWFRFGLLLHKVMTPLIMALMFFVVLTPTALLMRLFGQRPIARGFDRSAASYWIDRGEARPGAMSKQY